MMRIGRGERRSGTRASVTGTGALAAVLALAAFVAPADAAHRRRGPRSGAMTCARLKREERHWSKRAEHRESAAYQRAERRLAKRCSSPAAAPAPHWVGAWEGAPESGVFSVSNQSFRLLVHTSIGGSLLRLRFSNAYGTTPLTLSDVTVALPTQDVPGPSVDATTLRSVRFATGGQLTIPAGQDAYSLPIHLQVPGNAWLTVSFYVPGTYATATAHQMGMTTSYQTPSGGGDQASDPTGSGFTSPSFLAWTYLTGVDVVAPRRVSTVVALGDSITDCCIEIPDSNMRWPDLLDQRLAVAAGGQRFSVVNAGISGNDVSNDRGGNTSQGAAGDTRDARDVFAEPNVSTVILFEGINDVGTGVDAAHITAAYERILSDAHARGIRVLIATLTPCYGSVAYGTGYTTNAAVRDQVNSWITAHAGRFDGVIDFASVVANPADPDLWNPIYNVGDQLHPNPLGLKAMADSIPLDLFSAR